MNELRAWLALHRGIPKAIDIGRSVEAVPQIDRPLGLRDCSIKGLFVRCIEEDATLRSVLPVDLLKMHSFKNRQD